MKNYIILIATIMLSSIAYAQNTGPKIGAKVVKIKEKSVDGTELSLSDLRGKMVLIYFWASWCDPCRVENPILVSAYKEFKDKSFKEGEGFTIFSVSLDSHKEEWIQGIADDNLEWEYHVSNLMSWDSKYVKKYKLEYIPASFLINAKGVIVAKNLRGAALHEKLTELLK